MAEREGFEPSRRRTTSNGFRDRRIQPLCHLSARRRSGASGRRAGRADQMIGALLGCAPLPGQVPSTPAEIVHREAAEVAKAFGVTRPRIYQVLDHERERWLASPALEPLAGAAAEALAVLGGIAPLDEAAVELARRCGGGTDHASLCDAAALLRVLAEVQGGLGERAPVWLGRIHRKAWLAASPAALDGLRNAARLADRLAALDPLPSSEAVKEKLVVAVAGTDLEALPYARLIRLAAEAASRAAVSARLELYPPGLSAARALTLSASVLALPSLKPEELRRRVKERYPEAEALPEQPELDSLVEPIGFRFDPTTGYYKRPGLEPSSLTGTYVQPVRLPSAEPGEPRKETPAARQARAFEESLRVALSRARFRVIQVAADDAEVAASRLAALAGVATTSIDHTL